MSEGSNVLTPVLAAIAPPSKAIDCEWLDVFPNLHRCVAGRLNKRRTSESIRREDAIGIDRPPLGHAVLLYGEWIGKVRRNGAVVWTSPRFGSVEEAKAAIERQLARLPDLVAGVANLNHPQPTAMAA